MSTFSRPFRRVTTTPQIRLVAVTQLLDFVCSFRCSAHDHPAAVHEVMNGRITYAACCEDLIDLIEKALRHVPDPIDVAASRQREHA